MKQYLIGVALAGLVAHASACEAHQTQAAAGKTATKPARAMVMADAAWSRMTAPNVKVGGVFLTLTNHSQRDDVLLAVTTPVSSKVELHTHVNDNGVMRMREVAGGIAIGKGQTVVLQPGGLHIMLMNLQQPLKPNDRFPLTLKFKHAPAQTVTVTVNNGVAAGAASMVHAH